MKALSLTQPWASLVANGSKRIETRSFSTSYRGPLAIHASKGYPQWARATRFADGFREALAGELMTLPTGVVLATCELVGCFNTNGELEKFGVTEQERMFGDYAPNRFGWILRNVVRLPEPIPAKGALQLWEWEMPK